MQRTKPVGYGLLMSDGAREATTGTVGWFGQENVKEKVRALIGSVWAREATYGVVSWFGKKNVKEKALVQI
jgi:hypothetical protein